SLAAALGPFCENNKAVFRCPLDTNRYPTEGLSYEYQPRVAGKTMEQLRGNKLGLPLTEVWLTYDFDPVHGSDPDHPRNYLNADQKWELSAPMREKQKAEMDSYFAMSPKDKQKYLDERIDRSEKMRKEWEQKAAQGKGGAPGGASGGPGGNKTGGQGGPSGG